MEIKPKTPKGPIPSFLTQTLDNGIKADLRKAYAMHIRDLKITPAIAATMDIKLWMLLSNLKKFDPRWEDIPQEHIVTTNRKLITGMNTELWRFKLQHKQIQELIDELPPNNEQSQADDEEPERSHTETDEENKDGNEEEVKGSPYIAIQK